MSTTDSASRLRLVMVTVPAADVARAIARTLLEERLVACVNLLPAVHSLYRWQGKLEETDELLLVMKTVAERLPSLAARVKELHPYEVPEFIALPIDAALPSYAAWVVEETGDVIV